MHCLPRVTAQSLTRTQIAIVNRIELQRSKEYHRDTSFRTRYTCDAGEDFYYMKLFDEQGRAPSLPHELRDLELG